MDSLWKSIILGIIEGVTEFLPISSTGHLILANEFIKLDKEFAAVFDVVIQLGAILSVIVYFWDRLFPFSLNKSREQRNETWQLWFKTVAGVFPAVVIGFLFADKIEELLFNSYVVSSALIVGGIILLMIERSGKTARIESIKSLKYSTAIAIGFIQCLAMIPGTSRSAATILGAMALGASRAVAAEFSFFLAIPTMIGASGYSLMKSGLDLTLQQWQVLGVGFVVSFLVAWGVIAVFMNYIRRKDFKPFAYYRIILGLLVFAYFFFTGTRPY